MKATGITAEYNPLHNGHIYHLGKARALTGCDALVIAMSGDFVQRGEPALMDKWKRAELALRGGADLVVEIPALYCLGNAGQYASAGVKLLEALGRVTDIAFGSECGDIELLRSISGFIDQYSSELEQAIRILMRSGYNYPVARAKAYAVLRRNPDISLNDVFSQAEGTKYSELLTGTRDNEDVQIHRELRILESSNDILGMEYIRAMKSAVPVAVKREGAGYSDPYDIRFDYQSASALRTQLFAGADISKYVPESTYEMLSQSGLPQYASGHEADSAASVHLTGPDRDKWFDLLRYAVMSTPAEVIEDCPSGGEGLANLMKTEIMRTDSWTRFARRVKSKRYTYTRIMRLCAQVLLGITRNGFDASGGPEYIRVLGFTGRGRELLAEIRKTEAASMPVITNINKEKQLLSEKALRQLELDIHAADLYNLATGADIRSESDYRKIPVIFQRQPQRQ